MERKTDNELTDAGFNDRPKIDRKISLPIQKDEQQSRSVSPSTISMSSDHEKKPVHIPCRVANALYHQGIEADDFGVVRWLENSKKHPRRWSMIRKSYDTAIIVFLEFFMTLISNAGSSLAPQATIDLGLGRTTTLACFTTVYLVGQAIGGLILPPIAESFGGRSIYISSTLGFAFFCIIIAAWPVLPAVIIGRFGSGMLSAMPAVVAAGSIENMWDMRARTWVIHLWIAFAVLGLAVGPPIATYVSLSSIGWQGLFWISAIIAAIAALLCLGMQESRPSQLLKQKVKKVSRQTSFSQLSADVPTGHLPGLRNFVRTTLVLPIRLFFTEPIVFLTSIMAASVYGITYLFTEAFTVIYQDGFNFTQKQSSLVFLAIAGGIIFTFLPRIYDIRISNLRTHQNRPVEPEDKLFGFYIAAPILAIGLWIFSATVPPCTNLTPTPSIFSLVLYGFATVEFDSILSGYLTDTYASYAASANAPMAFLRAILSGTFPLFGEQMFRRLGSNNAGFLLAALATGYVGVAIWFGCNGRRIRMGSSFAEKTRGEGSLEGSGSRSEKTLVGSGSETSIVTVPERCHS